MIGYRQTLLVFLLMMLSGAAIAQNNTNSPYTRYGYGQLADQGSGNSKAMGGISFVFFIIIDLIKSVSCNSLQR